MGDFFVGYMPGKFGTCGDVFVLLLLQLPARSIDLNARVVQIGKNGLTPESIQSAEEVLEKRELIKVSVLNNCLEDPKEIAEKLQGRTRSHVVQVIGKKIILYRPSKKNLVQLPKK